MKQRKRIKKFLTQTIHRDLSEFMKSDNLELLWNLGQIQDAVRDELGGGGEKIEVEGANEAAEVAKEASESGTAGFYRLRSRPVGDGQR